MIDVALKKLVHDSYVYPRKHESKKTIESYAAAMLAGAEFPPIEAQFVSKHPSSLDEPIFIIIDGVHRWLAYQEANKKRDEADRILSIDVREWKPGTTLDYEENKIELRLEAAERNTRHGDRLSQKDKQTTACQIATDDPKANWTEQYIAEKLGVKRGRVHNWISVIRTRQKASRDAVIMRLSRLGWVQDKIAGVVQRDQGVISRIMQNVDFDKLHNLLAEGRPMEYIAELYHLDLPLAWSLRLEEKTDHERFKELGWGLRVWDNWAFNACDERFGDDWPGRIPAQLVAHTLYFFTRPGELVFDPMAGGGVVSDVCLAFNRRCRSYDLTTRDSRPEIERHHWDLVDPTWPEGMNKRPDLTFFDPPYFTKKAKEYAEKAEAENLLSISELSRDDYLAWLGKFFVLVYENTKTNGRLALLNAGWRDFQGISALDEDTSQSITCSDYERLMMRAGWAKPHWIDCPLSSQRFTGTMIKAMQEKRELGIITRRLLVARKGG